MKKKAACEATGPHKGRRGPNPILSGSLPHRSRHSPSPAAHAALLPWPPRSSPPATPCAAPSVGHRPRSSLHRPPGRPPSLLPHPPTHHREDKLASGASADAAAAGAQENRSGAGLDARAAGGAPPGRERRQPPLRVEGRQSTCIGTVARRHAMLRAGPTAPRAVPGPTARHEHGGGTDTASTAAAR